MSEPPNPSHAPEVFPIGEEGKWRRELLVPLRLQRDPGDDVKKKKNNLFLLLLPLPQESLRLRLAMAPLLLLPLIAVVNLLDDDDDDDSGGWKERSVRCSSGERR